jgi:hypothetical protein
MLWNLQASTVVIPLARWSLVMATDATGRKGLKDVKLAAS